MGEVRTGLDRIASGDADACRWLKGRRLGLLAHAASVDASLRSARSVLRAAGGKIQAVFGPEHGYRSAVQDMVAVGAVPTTHDVPVYSLYGDREADLSPRAEWLDGLGAVVIDLQDVGSRYYTFVWTAALVLRAAAARGVETIVLDRPNPLGGVHVEGAPQRPGYRSFVGLYEVAVRHGMTIGELCTMVRELEGLDSSALRVVRTEGWRREMTWAETGLPWVMPSPNMPTVDTALVYPGGCLIEGTNLSEGRGTTRPFEIWGAPWVDGERLAEEVSIDGAMLRPLVFRPSFHKFAGCECSGVQVHVANLRAFRPYEAYLRMVAWVKRQASELAWRTEPYEFVHDRPAVDLLTGGHEFRNAVADPSALEDYLAEQRAGELRFKQERERWLLYS